MNSSRIIRFGAFVASLLAFSLVAGIATAASTATVYATDATAWHPESVSIDVGGKVTWENRDTKYPHTVECDQSSSNAPCAWATALEMPARQSSLSQPSRVSVTFDGPGTYAYYCSIHPTMTGTIIVGSGHPVPTSTPTQAPPPSTGTHPTTRATGSTAPAASTSARASTRAAPRASVQARTTLRPGPTLSGKALGESPSDKKGVAGAAIPAALLIGLVAVAHVARARRRSA